MQTRGRHVHKSDKFDEHNLHLKKFTFRIDNKQKNSRTPQISA